MISCPKCSTKMDETLTKAGVVVDVCKNCKGIWLDRGELNFFTRNKDMLSKYDLKGLLHKKGTNYDCPKCYSKLNVGKIPSLNFEVEECSTCKGIYFDKSELRKVMTSKKISNLESDKSNSYQVEKLSSSNDDPKIKVVLPSLFISSGVLLITMYGALLGVVLFSVNYGLISYNLAFFALIGIISIQFLLGPILMDWSLKLFGLLSWKDLDSLPKSLNRPLRKLCIENNIPLPRFGIIDDGSPQAYTYGRTPWSARVVFSRGIIELLDDDEIEAVLAHELGHIKHWDFMVMTLAQLIPVSLYHIYRICDRANSNSRSSSSGKDAVLFIIPGLIAYMGYFVSEYFVKFLSRAREYHADKFSCYATGKPNSLLTALVKISFGMSSLKSHGNKSQRESKKNKYLAVESMGIMSISNSSSISLLGKETASDEVKQLEAIKNIMRWDLWSPWSIYYELKSTHPLTSKRINNISSFSIEMKQKPKLLFDLKKPESYWDDFIIDIVVLLLPIILGSILFFCNLLLVNQSFEKLNWYELLSPLFWGICFGGILRTKKVYPSGPFLNYSVLALLRKIKISPVRTFPVTLKGHIIGRGDAGNITSEDMVLKDKSGMIYLNHEPLGPNFIFGLARAKNFHGQDVIVEGWYRRSPVPNIEIKKITSKLDSSMSYSSYIQLLGWCSFPILIYIAKIIIN